MKFLCNSEFIHSGTRSYTPGVVYPDFTAEYAEKLIALEPKKPLGALSFFTPVGEEAVNFLKTVKRNPGKGDAPTPPADRAGTGEGTVTTPRKPTKQELVAEAKNLGIKGADRMSVDDLVEVIAAKKGETGQQTTTPPVPPAGGTGAGEGSGAVQ
jgi:hypothetical protein